MILLVFVWNVKMAGLWILKIGANHVITQFVELVQILLLIVEYLVKMIVEFVIVQDHVYHVIQAII